MNNEEDFKKVWSTQLTPKLRTNILPAINSAWLLWWRIGELRRRRKYSALVDPLVLGMISSERRLRIRFHEFGMLGGTLDIDINTVKFRFG